MICFKYIRPIVISMFLLFAGNEGREEGLTSTESLEEGPDYYDYKDYNVGLASEGNGDLTSESVSEGPCDPNIRDYAAKNIDPAFTTMPVNYYVPMASEGCYRGYAEVLLGRPAKSQEELDSMKLRIRVRVPPIFYSYGFDSKLNRRVRQSCVPPLENLSGDQVLCRPLTLGNAPDTDTSGIRTSLDTIVFTDNNSTLLIVRCLNDKVRDYKVLTTGPKVSPIIQQAVEDKIVELGFSKDLLRVKDDYNTV